MQTMTEQTEVDSIKTEAPEVATMATTPPPDRSTNVGVVGLRKRSRRRAAKLVRHRERSVLKRNSAEDAVIVSATIHAAALARDLRDRVLSHESLLIELRELMDQQWQKFLALYKR